MSAPATAPASAKQSTMVPFAPGDILLGATDLNNPADDHAGDGRIFQFDKNFHLKGVLYTTGTTHLVKGLTFGPDGWLYGCQGSTVTANIRGIEFQQGVWRYHPVTREFELFCEGGGNSWGLDFDETGRLKHGDFIETVVRLMPFYWVRAVGGLLFLAGVLMGALILLMTYLHRGADLSDATISNVNLYLADGTGAKFERTYGTQAILIRTRLQRATFENAKLIDTDFRNASLGGANFRNAYLGGARFDQVNLGRLDMRGANLEVADLPYATMRGVNLEGANLTDADLWGADLTDANLRGATLNNTRLEGATTTDTVFDGATMLGTVLPNGDVTPGAP